MTLDLPAERHATRLVGRARELAEARAFLAQPAGRVLVVRGAAGAGKTALLRTLLAEAQAAGAITGAGKYAEGHSGRDLEPLIAAVEAAVSAGLDQLFDPEAGLSDLGRALGDNAQVFASLGAGLLGSLAVAAAPTPVTAERADEQLIQALREVLQWLEGFGAPVLLLIDDWGRAGPQAQRALRRLATARGLQRTRLLATERDEEPFRGGLETGVVTVRVGPLSRSAQLELAGERLGPRAAAASDVLAFLDEAAERPFDLIESIRVLTASDALVRRGGSWRLDLPRATPALAGAAARSVVRRAAEADADADRLARLLAVYGDGAETEDLARAARMEPQAARRALAALAQAGLVRWSGDKAAFAHDRLRAEVLLALDAAERGRTAAALAEALRAAGVAPGDGERGMSLLWLREEAGLHDADAVWWRDAFALGAFRARQIGDRTAAERFVGAAVRLAEGGAGYSYALLAEAAFAAITRGEHAEARRHADRMEVYAATPAELAAAHEMRVFARRASGDLDAALEVAREVLARTGVRLPRKVTPWNLLVAVVRVFRLDPRRAGARLDAEALAVEAPMMRAMNGIGSLLFERNPLLVIGLVTRSLSPAVVYGTAAGAATFTLMCCGFGAYRRAAAWADAADRLQGPDQPLRAVAKQYSTNFGHVFVRPRPVTRTRGDEMVALAYAGGDLAVAAYGNRDKVLDATFSDDPLAGTEDIADEAIRVAERFSDAPTIPHVRALRQFIEQLRRGGADGWRLDGVHFDLAAQRQALQGDGLANTARGVAALEALLGVLFGRYGEVALLTRRPWPSFGGAPFQAQTQIWNFATGLALYRTGRRPGRLPLWNLRRLGRLNPNDFRHRARLLDAEQARARGRRRAALAAYAEAVEAAAQSRCLLEHGLVAAAAAEGADALGEAARGRLWRDAAIAAWRRLGADALLTARFGIAPTTEPAAAEPAPLDAARLAAAERASRAKSRLLAAVGHELRTPLQGALGLVELAEGGDEALDLPTLREAIRHLAGVVGDLTDLGALEGGVVTIRPVVTDARAVAASVAALHEPAARAAGRRIEAAAGPPLWVLADEGRLRQVLGNLAANGLRHGRGTVRVSVERLPGDRLRFSVTDEGPALGPAEALRIFEPFDRAGGEAGEGGLGLGLFLGRHLARAMGGDLSVRALAKGKAFDLEVSAPAAGPPPPVEAATLAGLKVLLAEDADLSRRVLAALLRREGCEVVEVPDGTSARAALAQGCFDLVLLDQRMPGATGLEVAAGLPTDAARPRTVLMTANVDADIERQASAAGVDQVLQKPVGLAELKGAALGLGRREPAAAPSRVADLRRLLGEDAEPLLQALKPALEAELARLPETLSAGDPEVVQAHLHRIKGLAAHFGLAPVERAVAAAQADVAASHDDLPRRLRAALDEVDWSAFAAPRPEPQAG